MEFPENAPFGFLGIMYEKRNNFRRFTVDSVGQEIKNWIIIFFVYSYVILYLVKLLLFPAAGSDGGSLSKHTVFFLFSEHSVRMSALWGCV